MYTNLFDLLAGIWSVHVVQSCVLLLFRFLAGGLIHDRQNGRLLIVPHLNIKIMFKFTIKSQHNHQLLNAISQ